MKHVYTDIAKAAIEDVLYDRETIDREKLIENYPELAQKGATFVTLTLHGALRGCVGSLSAHRPLIDDLIDNARSAAFRDPRFYPCTITEFDEVATEVSLLNEPKLLEYSSIADLKRKVRPSVDGVVLSLNGRRATFLPQVWDELPTFELFFSHLCQKAGLGADCLEEQPEIELYQVEKVK
ncbi:MAG: AmmeMemoRadiSam system protein A [Thiovulaceae bacterium]|nr:AmmeMemoRadiSam system protein A [Sulfurimonadaceae bacterium]